MDPISFSLSGTANLPNHVHSPGAASDIQEPSRLEPADPAAQKGSAPANTDRYTPGEKPDGTGRYWPGTDENGKPKICQDSPKENAPQKDAEQRCTVNTDRVDREIEKLRQERQALERQLRSETDETKRQTARQRLEQVERELSQKDNDAYRRRNAVYTCF